MYPLEYLLYPCDFFCANTVPVNGMLILYVLLVFLFEVSYSICLFSVCDYGFQHVPRLLVY